MATDRDIVSATVAGAPTKYYPARNEAVSRSALPTTLAANNVLPNWRSISKRPERKPATAHRAQRLTALGNHIAQENCPQRPLATPKASAAAPAAAVGPTRSAQPMHTVWQQVTSTQGAPSSAFEARRDTALIIMEKQLAALQHDLQQQRVLGARQEAAVGEIQRQHAQQLEAAQVSELLGLMLCSVYTWGAGTEL